MGQLIGAVLSIQWDYQVEYRGTYGKDGGRIGSLGGNDCQLSVFSCVVENGRW